MNRSVRNPVHSVLALVMMLILTWTLAQPATMSRAQESTPPSSTPTVVSNDPAQDNSPSSQQHVAIVNPDGSIPPPSSAAAPGDYDAQAQQPEPAPPPAPAASAAADVQTLVAPQAAPQTGFQINIVSKSTVRADNKLTYTIYFTNTASTTYQNVLIQNGIGAGQYYRGCSGPDFATCVFTYTGTLAQAPVIDTSLSNGDGNSSNSRQMVWKLGTVAPGQKGNIKYTVQVHRDLYPQSGQSAVVLGNTVALYKDGQITSNTKLNEDQWGVLITGPAFYITKTATPEFVLQGDKVDFEITVGNATGPNDVIGGVRRRDAETATQPVVVDVLPIHLENIQPKEGGVFNPANRWLTWNLSSPLAPGQEVKVHFSATIKNDLSECNTMHNRGFATSSEMPMRDAEIRIFAEGQVESHTNVVAPAYAATSVSPGSVRVGENATWTIQVKNYWKTAITGATVKFYLENSNIGSTPFQYVSSNPNGQFDQNNYSVTWSNLTLPAKTSFSAPGILQFTVTAKASRFLDGHKGVAVITLPAGIPSSCLKSADAGIGVDPLLLVVKSVNVTAPVLAGTDVIYTIDVYNYSKQEMTDVSLVDTLPRPHDKPFVYKGMVSGPAPTTITGPTANSNQVLRWENLRVPVGSGSTPGQTTLRFTATADGIPNDCVDNSVEPDSSISQARRANGGNVCIAFPWSVVKTASRTSIAPRDPNRRLDFTITFENLTTTPQLITPSDFMAYKDPRYTLRFVSMIQGPPPVSATPDSEGYLKWPPVTLGSKAKLVYKYTAEMPTDTNNVIYPGIYCNRAYLDPDGYDYVVWNEVCIVVSSIDLIVSKQVNRDTVGLGELLTYNIILENRSTTDDVTGMVISDTLPVNMTYVGPDAGAPAPKVTSLPNGQQRLNWDGIIVTKNSQKGLVFKVRAPALINQYRNVAQISGGMPLPNLICQNPTQGYTGCNTGITVNVINVIAIKPDVTPSIIDPTELVTYTLSLVSNNNIPYQNTIVTQTLPLGFTFVKMVSGPAPFQPREGVIVWGNQTVPAKTNVEGKLTLVFQAKAPKSYGSFTSKIDASSPTGVIPTADSVARILIAPKTPALSLLAPPLVEIGSEVEFKISLINPESSPVTNIVVEDVLPEGFTFKGVKVGSTAPAVSGQKLTWSNLTLPGLDDDEPGLVEIIFYATAPAKAGTHTNKATATGSRAIDQTYNTVKIVVAKLRYTYLAIVRTSP